MYDLNGKTALVTGGAKRLGQAICLDLAKAGVNIVVHYLDSQKAAQDVAQQVRELGCKAWTIPSDLADRKQTEKLVSRAIDVAGPIDILINNASIFFEDRLDSFTGEALDLNVQINAFGPLVLSREFTKQADQGVIINLLDSRIAAHDDAHAAYHLSKRMLFSITKMSAVEFAPKVRVNAVAPGLVLPPPGKDLSYLENLKDSLPLKMYGSADHIARTTRFLISNDFVTGQVIYVDGGRHLKTSVYS